MRSKHGWEGVKLTVRQGKIRFHCVEPECRDLFDELLSYILRLKEVVKRRVSLGDACERSQKKNQLSVFTDSPSRVNSPISSLSRMKHLHSCDLGMSNHFLSTSSKE